MVIFVSEVSSLALCSMMIKVTFLSNKVKHLNIWSMRHCSQYCKSAVCYLVSGFICGRYGRMVDLALNLRWTRISIAQRCHDSARQTYLGQQYIAKQNNMLSTCQKLAYIQPGFSKNPRFSLLSPFKAWWMSSLTRKDHHGSCQHSQSALSSSLSPVCGNVGEQHCTVSLCHVDIMWWAF